MKGISLPINAIVVVAIAVLVMVVIAAFFTGAITGGFGTIGDQEAWNKGCAQAIARGCTQADFGISGTPITIPGYDPDGNGVNDTIIVACQAIYSFPSTAAAATIAADCRNFCCG